MGPLSAMSGRTTEGSAGGQGAWQAALPSLLTHASRQRPRGQPARRPALSCDWKQQASPGVKRAGGVAQHQRAIAAAARAASVRRPRGGGVSHGARAAPAASIFTPSWRASGTWWCVFVHARTGRSAAHQDHPRGTAAAAVAAAAGDGTPQPMRHPSTPLVYSYPLNQHQLTPPATAWLHTPHPAIT